MINILSALGVMAYTKQCYGARIPGCACCVDGATVTAGRNSLQLLAATASSRLLLLLLVAQTDRWKSLLLTLASICKDIAAHCHGIEHYCRQGAAHQLASPFDSNQPTNQPLNQLMAPYAQRWHDSITPLTILC